MSWHGLSIFGLMLGALALLMLAPAALAASWGDLEVAGVFAVCACLPAIASGLFIVATRNAAARTDAMREFAVVVSAMLVAPAFAAAPIAILAPYLGYAAAYFEMVSTFTTTGASVFDRPSEIPAAINLWRAMTAWAGGFVILCAAYALFAPRNLGGFEVRGDLGRSGAIGRLRGAPEWAGGRGREAAADRIAVACRDIAPVYGALTLALMVLLIALGEAPLNAAIVAMGAISTSGVQATEEAPLLASGYVGEAILLVFLILAVTRHSYGGGGRKPLRLARLPGDPEMNLFALVVGGVTLWIFLRHWSGAFEVGEDLSSASAALWGAFVTVLSFATTTGYESASWDAAQAWSGLSDATLILFGLVIIGGGVATTAGGIKLLRAYALFNHGRREMERLVRPSSISGTGARKRGLRREGAQIAWVFVMLFLVSMATSMLALSLTGLDFEMSLAASIAAFSNAGPVFTAVNDEASWLTSLNAEGRAVIVAAMALGRVELLALIAMINPDNWR